MASQPSADKKRHFRAESMKSAIQQSEQNLRTADRYFEARVLVNGLPQMFHYWAKDQEQAQVKARKKGRVQSVRKVDASEYTVGIETLKLEPVNKGLYLGAGVYENDFNLDEILGLRKKKKTNFGKKNKGRGESA